MKQRFAVAPWPLSLWLISLLATVLLIGVGYAAYQAAPALPGFTHRFGLVIAGLNPAILAGSLLFTVTGYTLDGSDLLIHRLFWSTRFSLFGLRQVLVDPKVCKGSFRLFGNSGLFAFTGLYQNRTLGRYRLFATDFTRAVALISPARTLVITPKSPPAFIAAVHRAFPQAVAEHPTLPGSQ
ncbi:MAG TPA: PH domain-containing protein [Candidatus Competibacteraceae bacterium]|nr:PH domain-containing protein [Candidatus Competibacteraceae bacterium]HQA25132.1 PH domain-containing protein [Candidatus Competibacteraceae bacterium]HQD55131.1 PH domain-containing protein [Candidatus Competibacteraceae bacterium]